MEWREKRQPVKEPRRATGSGRGESVSDGATEDEPKMTHAFAPRRLGQSPEAVRDRFTHFDVRFDGCTVARPSRILLEMLRFLAAAGRSIQIQKTPIKVAFDAI